MYIGIAQCPIPAGAGNAGLGDLSDTASSLTDFASGDFLGMPVWALLLAGGAVALWLGTSPGGSEYRKKSKQLRSQYRGYKRASRRLRRASRKVVSGMTGGTL
jgi:hypothetical protein